MSDLRPVTMDQPGGLQGAGSVMQFARDREIFAEGADGALLFRVLFGQVRTCKSFSDGRRQIDAFHGPGDVFGFEAGALQSLSAEAVSDCTVIAYRWRGPGAGDAALSAQLFAHAVSSLARAQRHSCLLGRCTASEKVAAFLLEQAECSADHHVVTLAMTRHDIADYLGLTTETVSRTLSQFERAALIEATNPRHIHLRDPAGLRALVS